MKRKKEKIRLAICSTGELFGGVEQCILSLSKYLKDETRIEFIVVLFHEGALSRQLGELGVETHVISSHKYNPLAVLKIRDLFRERNINVVHIHGYKANILCGVAARLAGISTIKTEHGKIEPSGGNLPGAVKMKANIALDHLLTRWLTKKVIFVSRELEGHYLGIYAKKQCGIIYNGIMPQDALRYSPQKKKGVFEAGIVGRLSEVKGHIYLLRALKLLSDIPVHLKIFGEGGLERLLREYCKDNSLQDRVSFMGFRKDINEQIRNLDLLVMPSLHEGLPYTLLEAMYLKVPVIASRVGSLKEILVDGQDALLVPPADPQSLANAIRTLYGDASKRKALAVNAHKKVLDNFMVERMAGQYVSEYGKLCSNS